MCLPRVYLNGMKLKPDEILRAAALLRAGEPVAIPTETVYGLAAPVFDAKTVAKVFSLKGRPSDNPLIAHVSSTEMVGLIAEHLPEHFFRLTKAFWPGPLTLIVPRKNTVPDIVSAGHPTIAVRMPSHPVALALIDAVGPLVAPSANLSGKPSPTCAEHVLEDLNVPVLDGGPCAVGIESTVLSLVQEKPTLMRPGAVGRKELEAVLGVQIVVAEKHAPTLSPGMKYRHYAPKAYVRVVHTPSDVKGDFVLSRLPVGNRVHRKLESQSLYGFFREADRLGVSEVWVVLDPSTDEALCNRVLTASAR